MKRLILVLGVLLLTSCKYITVVADHANITTNILVNTVTNIQTTNNKIIEPPASMLGGECPVPAGMDIRFLIWSVAYNDWVFFGNYAINEHLVDINGNKISAKSKLVPEGFLAYQGYRAPKSVSVLITNNVGEYRETYRVYYKLFK